MIKINDICPSPTGRLTINVFKHGSLIEQWGGENLIVANTRSLLASLLGGTTTNKFVTQIGFGTSGTAPNSTNTALTAPFYKTLGSVTFPSAGVVSFNFSLATTEANGKAIIEFGILTGDTTLVARKVRSSAINKDNTISFTGSWTVTF